MIGSFLERIKQKQVSPGRKFKGTTLTNLKFENDIVLPRNSVLDTNNNYFNFYDKGRDSSPENFGYQNYRDPSPKKRQKKRKIKERIIETSSANNTDQEWPDVVTLARAMQNEDKVKTVNIIPYSQSK